MGGLCQLTENENVASVLPGGWHHRAETLQPGRLIYQVGPVSRMNAAGELCIPTKQITRGFSVTMMLTTQGYGVATP